MTTISFSTKAPADDGMESYEALEWTPPVETKKPKNINDFNFIA